MTRWRRRKDWPWERSSPAACAARLPRSESAPSWSMAIAGSSAGRRPSTARPATCSQIQTSIAEAVAQQLRSQLGAADRAALTVGGTHNAAAQDLVLKADANQDGSKEGFLARVALYDAAIALDPQYAMAYAGKASAATSAVSYYANTAEEMQTGLDSRGRGGAKGSVAGARSCGRPLCSGLTTATAASILSPAGRNIGAPLPVRAVRRQIMVGVANFLGVDRAWRGSSDALAFGGSPRSARPQRGPIESLSARQSRQE